MTEFWTVPAYTPIITNVINHLGIIGNSIAVSVPLLHNPHTVRDDNIRSQETRIGQFKEMSCDFKYFVVNGNGQYVPLETVVNIYADNNTWQGTGVVEEFINGDITMLGVKKINVWGENASGYVTENLVLN
jgi:hypothetical protein